jgi:hypothetical protein
MLKKLSHDRFNPPVSDVEAVTIPDPWEAEDITMENAIPQPWNFHPETHPLIAQAQAPDGLIAPAGTPGLPQLTGHDSTATPNLIKTLVQDEVKVKAFSAGNLANQVGNALTLLCWTAE